MGAVVHWIRILRIVAGVMLLVQAVQQKSIIIGALGVVLLWQGVLNVGCCGTACAAPRRTSAEPSTSDIQFEEVK